MLGLNILEKTPRLAGNTKHVRILNLLSKVASDISYPTPNNAKLAACVVYQNNIVAFGVNEQKTHPLQAKYSTMKDAIYLHAEISAIKNALRQISVEELENCSLYIARVKYSNNKKTSRQFGLARPCPGCENCINAFGIRKVYHTTDDGGYTQMS